MKKLYSAAILSLFTTHFLSAQPTYVQYFDGADTSVTNSLIVQFDTSSSNIWQVGPPQKIIFNSPATVPNVLITDTINNYPINNTSRVVIKVNPMWTWGLLAMQWKQKLDLDSAGGDGAIIDYSVDAGNTWTNVFNDPHVFNFYGYQPANVDTMPNGEYCLNGRDTNWTDVWLCFDMSWLSLYDSVYFRYTLKTDSINQNKEGWMIDNMMSHITMMHPVKETNKKDYMSVYPNPTTGIVNIEIQKIQEFHIIEDMQLITEQGVVLKEWKNIPGKYWIDISKYPDGIYMLKVKTNLKSETIPVILKRT